MGITDWRWLQCMRCSGNPPLGFWAADHVTPSPRKQTTQARFLLRDQITHFYDCSCLQTARIRLEAYYTMSRMND